MAFESGVFYRRNADGIVFRCELVRDTRTLLHSADMAGQPAHDHRVVGRNVSVDEWTRIADEDESPFLESYRREAIAEHGAEADDKTIVYRRQYHFDPYMQPVGDAEIQDRLNIIADNSIRYGADGKPRIFEEAKEYWHRKAEDAVEEIRTAGRKAFVTSDPNDPRRKKIKLHHDIRAKPGYAESVPWGRIPKFDTSQGLFKFDKRKHLRRTYDEGVIRVSPAASYADASLNPARADANEGRLVLRPSKRGFPIVVTSPHRGTILDTAAEREDQIAIELGGELPFYVWCCSDSYEPRLFVDFQADACLVIRDHEAFARRLNAALLERHPGMPLMQARAVRYYDPLCPDDSLQDMFSTPLAWAFFKDWRYTYQAEFRFVWPERRGDKLEQVEVTLGPLHDICDLIVLSDQRGGA